LNASRIESSVDWELLVQAVKARANHPMHQRNPTTFKTIRNLTSFWGQRKRVLD